MRNRLAGVRDPGRVRSVLEGTSTSIRTTEKILFSSDWRRIGAIGYLWFDIGVLIACFAAIGPVPPLACIVLAYPIGYIANMVPIPGSVGVLDGSFVGMLVLYGINATAATPRPWSTTRSHCGSHRCSAPLRFSSCAAAAARRDRHAQRARWTSRSATNASPRRSHPRRPTRLLGSSLPGSARPGRKHVGSASTAG
jgi:hypothetical protein